MEIIKDRIKFKLRRGIVKVNIDLEEKMLSNKRPISSVLRHGHVEHRDRKLQVEVEA